MVKFLMYLVFSSLLIILLLWSGSLFDWMVNYATSFAQLGVWITLLSLISGYSVWTSFKKGSDEPWKKKIHTNLSISIKA